MKFKKLLFGTAGIPVCLTDRSSEKGVEKVHELGLDCMELEFVRGVHTSKQSTEPVREAAQKNKVVLTAHAPYYVNLNSDEPQKIGASRSRILQTANIAKLCGAFSITFHAAFYMKQQPEKVYENVKAQLKKVVDTLKEEGNDIEIRPELTGKPTQWGDLPELIKVSQELDQVLPCVDFAHYHARYSGKHNSYEYYRKALEQLEAGLGREILDNMHIHISGINYTAKGERSHLNLSESDLKYTDILKAWKEFDIKGVVISESPSIEGDALLLQKLYNK
ncbi:TIM barrel protein [Candidatus Woesearchaeota archaeon]|nr:TIM barrel protein [Candidatus Woesearchaeota archaeon]